MEDVLEVYHRPYDGKRPLVCLDEASKQLIGETVLPLPAEPGQPERFDYEYVRHGTANLFMICEPLLGWRTVQVTERRTAKDFAEVLRWLVEELHPALCDGGDWPLTLRDAYASLELISAIYYSAASNAAVDLPLSPDHAVRDGWAAWLK